MYNLLLPIIFEFATGSYFWHITCMSIADALINIMNKKIYNFNNNNQYLLSPMFPYCIVYWIIIRFTRIVFVTWYIYFWSIFGFKLFSFIWQLVYDFWNFPFNTFVFRRFILLTFAFEAFIFYIFVSRSFFSCAFVNIITVWN